jgi:ketosteroid isomerase-like protein
MRLRHVIVMGFVFLVVRTAPMFGQTTEKAKYAVAAADAAWLKAYQAKDVGKSVAFYDERGSMLAPNTPIATGKDALAQAIAGAFAMPGYNLVWHLRKVGLARSEDLGHTSGSYDSSFQDASGKTISDTGKYLTVWKKQANGAWKVLFDMFNSDLPAAPGVPA